MATHGRGGRGRRLLQAGRRRARSSAADEGRPGTFGRGRPGRRGGARGGGTCCLGPCAPGRPPLFSSWRSRRRRAAPRRSRALPLRTDGAVSGPPRPPAARPPGHKGARATSVPTLQVLGRLQQQQQGVQLHPAARARDGGGRCPARSGRLRSPPAPRPAAHLPDSRTPALGRHPLPRALKLTHKGEWRSG
jgi:hypothetical protein